jgi:hypothetical protein
VINLLPGRLNLEVFTGTAFSKIIQLWQPTTKIRIDQLVVDQVVYFNGLPEVVSKIVPRKNSLDVYLRNGVIGDPVFSAYIDDQIFLAGQRPVYGVSARFETIVDPAASWIIDYVDFTTEVDQDNNIQLSLPDDLTADIPVNSYSWDMTVDLAGSGSLVRLLEGTMIVSQTDALASAYSIPPSVEVNPTNG